MATHSEASGFCPVCGQWRLIRKQTMSRGAIIVHSILSLLTIGMWLLFFGLHALMYVGRKRCTVCGTAVAVSAPAPPLTIPPNDKYAAGMVAAPTSSTLPPPAPAADWYSDPRREARLRYWDGEAWTEHTTE